MSEVIERVTEIVAEVVSDIVARPEPDVPAGEAETSVQEAQGSPETGEPSCSGPEPPEPDPAQEAHERAIQESEAQVGECAVTLARLKAEAKKVSKLLDAAVERLATLKARGPDRYPLLDRPPEPAEAATAGPETDDDDEPWRATPISSLGLTDGAIDALAEADIQTVGDLTDHVKRHGDFWWRDIAGIGEQCAEKISDAMVKFWEEHPEYCRGGSEAADSTEGGTSDEAEE